MSLTTPIVFELPESTYESFEYVSTGMGLLTRSLTILCTIAAFRLFLESFSWCIQKWRRFIALIVLLALIITWQKATGYIDSAKAVVDWMRAIPSELVLNPFHEIVKWFVQSWDDLTNLDTLGMWHRELPK